MRQVAAQTADSSTALTVDERRLRIVSGRGVDVPLLPAAEVPGRRAADDLLPLVGGERTPGRRTRAANPLPGVQIPAQHGAADRRRPQRGA
jgi:hypothetical protein